MAENGQDSKLEEHPSAMSLFAPATQAVDSAGNEENALDLDELFRDCYFGDFPIPSMAEGGAPLPAAAAAPPPPPAKRKAEEMIAASKPLYATTGGVTTASAAGSSAGADTSSQPAPVKSSTSGDGAGGTKPELTEAQKIERRERNREHAKRSRLRKKFLLESLQEQIHGLQGEIATLKNIIKAELPDKAEALLKKVGSTEGDFTPIPTPSGFGPVKTLMEPDFRLMKALSGSQQNFAISDPSLPDNPIVYVSQGFLDLTGYTLDQVLGRNCRFLQGPGTDQAAVDIIRKGIREGIDTSVCLLNYKADGTPFWNQFFVAALRDAENNVVNFVGVQCEVSKAVVDQQIKDGKMPAPIGGTAVTK